MAFDKLYNLYEDNIYDALVLPAGKTRAGKREFIAAKRAVREFDTGKYGCIFVTGGYDGFVKKEIAPGSGMISNAEDTANFLKRCGIPAGKIFIDGRSLEAVGSLVFPVVNPIYENPGLDELHRLRIVAKDKQLWRLKDYASLILPRNKIVYLPVYDKDKKTDVLTTIYHAGIMAAMRSLGWNVDPKSISDFLKEYHPFYSEGWFEKSPLVRKAQMTAVGLSWLGGLRI